MRSTLTIGLAAFLFYPFATFGGNEDLPSREVTYIKGKAITPDLVWQQQLREGALWQGFLQQHGTWYVEFNEAAHLPHRAFGAPIAVNGSGPADKALNFLAQSLAKFGVDAGQLELMSTPATRNHTFVHFKQKYQGLDVKSSHYMVKLDALDRVIMFAMDIYDLEGLSTAPAIAPQTAAQSAQLGLTGVQNVTVSTDLAVLPIPEGRSYKAHLIYQVEVDTRNAELPGHYICWVDANTGELLYRKDRVVNHAPPGNGADLDLTGTLFEVQPYIPATVQPLRNVDVTINGNTFNTDQNGQLSSGITGPVNATIRLQGLWSTVRTGGNTPQFNVSLNDGANAISFDSDANSKELSAYFHVNIVHDHMKSILPTFTGMDFSLTTNVDVAGNCNAFYDGSSINFYAEGNDCHSWAKLGEVVYHEYGHGINDNFYQANGAFFQNGAMGEGYSDIWALSITEDPILAEGNSLSDPNDFIRRYDEQPKVYPQDLVGAVHADGEIIAGAWWDTYVLLGNNMPLMMQLFADAYPGLQAQTPNGNEGVAFRDVLIDALQADDNDGDITNGTPNGSVIVEAFAIHGITLLSNATLDHTALEAANASDDMVIQADLNLTFPFTNYLGDVKLFYRINSSNVWTSVVMNDLGNMEYEAVIPGQPLGTVVGYYIGVEDIFQQLSGVKPIAAHIADPNLPYFVLVGYALEATEDADDVNELGNWTTGLPTDNATTGQWELTIPVGSFGTPGDPSTIVQTDEQHTPGGELCWVTGNASSPTAALGENDVDGGTTTLISDPIDISTYTNPTFTFYRWYINNPPSGANPGADWWQVSVTDDGQNWVFVEETKTSDKSWRRMAFRVQDYVNISSQFQIKFNASDSIRMGQNLNGGSLIEAAVDDIQLWDNNTVGVDEIAAVQLNALYPDPASDLLNVQLDLGPGTQATMHVMDLTGRVVGEVPARNVHKGLTTIDVSYLANGQYILRVQWDAGSLQQEFMVIH